jgi:hypothetical protein
MQGVGHSWREVLEICAGRLDGVPTRPSPARRLGYLPSTPRMYEWRRTNPRALPLRAIRSAAHGQSAQLGVSAPLLRLSTRKLIVDLVSHDGQAPYRDLQSLSQLYKAAVGRIPGSPLEPGDMGRMQA